METAETVIIGGGIVGCAAAYYLAARGVRPVVLERRGIAAEASGANAGMVGAASGVPGKTLAHTKKSLELMVSAALELGRPVELVREGRLTLACSDVEWPEVEEFAASRRREGIAVEVVLRDGLRRLEPGLGAHVAGAAFVPGDGHVNPILLTLAYASAARRLGAEIRQGIEVTSLQVSRDRVAAVLTPGGPIAASTVIIAAGAWSRPLLAPLGIPLPIRPGRGQMLVTEALPPLTARVLRTSTIGICQDIRGHVLIGSTVEDVGFNREVTLPTLASFARLAEQLMPALTNAHVLRTWAGLRPMTPDGLAIIDSAPGVDGLFLAAGHSRTGITYAPVTGWLLAQLVTEGTTALPLDPFRLQRFVTAQPRDAVTGRA